MAKNGGVAFAIALGGVGDVGGQCVIGEETERDQAAIPAYVWLSTEVESMASCKGEGSRSLGTLTDPMLLSVCKDHLQ